VIIPRFVRRLFRAPFDGLKHFGVVEDGGLYRCGQPTPAQLAELIRRHSLRTVIALRGSRRSGDGDAWQAAEQRACERQRVQFIALPCNHRNPPTLEQVRRFLDLLRDERRRPALVHCRLGQQRTGLFCALYRVHVQGVDPQQALQEMDRLGFNIRRRRHRRLLAAYLRYAHTPELRNR